MSNFWSIIYNVQVMRKFFFLDVFLKPCSKYFCVLMWTSGLNSKKIYFVCRLANFGVRVEIQWRFGCCLSYLSFAFYRLAFIPICKKFLLYAVADACWLPQVEAASKYSTVDTLKQQYCSVPQKYKVVSFFLVWLRNCHKLLIFIVVSVNF